MTSLLVKHADEIIAAMAKTLGDEEFTKMFKTASVEKTAGQAFETYKKDIDAAVQQNRNLDEVYQKHLGELQKEDATDAKAGVKPGAIEKAQAYKAQAARTPGHRQPGQAYPGSDADAEPCMSADCMENMVDDQEVVAAEFALSHLAKLADVLDGQGFTRLASIIDVTMEHIASKKKIS